MRIRDLFGVVVFILLAIVGGSLINNQLHFSATSVSASEMAHDEHPSSDSLVPVTASECHAQTLAEVKAKLARTDEITWLWADLPDDVAGYAYSGNVIALDPGYDCKWTASVAMHEWMHIASFHIIGWSDDSHNGESVDELIADCGSKILGERFGYPTYTNYADRAGGCTEEINETVIRILQTY